MGIIFLNKALATALVLLSGKMDTPGLTLISRIPGNHKVGASPPTLMAHVPNVP